MTVCGTYTIALSFLKKSRLFISADLLLRSASASSLTSFRYSFQFFWLTLPRADPIPTASAPALISWAALSPSLTPPIPIIGTSSPTAFLIAVMSLRAVSKIPSPLTPPLPPIGLLRIGLCVIGSICSSGPTVLIATMPSAPLSTTALAIEAISSTFGVSFINNRHALSFVASLIFLVYSDATNMSLPIDAPNPFFACGHEKLSSTESA